MAGPVRLAIDHPRVLRDLRRGYAVQDRIPRAGVSALGPRPFSLCASRPRVDAAATPRDVEVADKEPHETGGVARVRTKGQEIDKGRFA